MAVFTILYGNYYPPHGEFELICIGKFSRRTWVNFTQQYGKNHQRCQQNKFTMLYGDYCYIFIENFPQKFSPCNEPNCGVHNEWVRLNISLILSEELSTEKRIWRSRELRETQPNPGRLRDREILR